ncbi:tetratricopeptide repeat protein [Algisphaera agarilytica]|uniref:Tetratricopeptide (TPR) repeat protein n=1 Tax=Algisphaera agarilytica TaxID=1385975 RepID=A0A7X0LKZ9_9BACT|nr:tetratricopeptide repeat protein [Algisphaera agarilytica]MBB6430364.1 tetratricopeptide (TPR) repeat protein [Algisphaera agarilytica]
MSEPFTAPTLVPDAVRNAGDGVLFEAARALEAKKWRKAERLCRQVLRIDPNHPTAVHLLGLAAHRGGHVFDALSLLRRSIELDDTQPIWWFNLGVSCAAGDRHAEASECYRAALRLQPYLVPALYMLGRSLQTMGLLDDAAAALAQALRIEPGHEEASDLLQSITRDLRDAA